MYTFFLFDQSLSPKENQLGIKYDKENQQIIRLEELETLHTSTEHRT